MDTIEAQLRILSRVLAADGEAGRITQRDLAIAAGLSLGMTNLLLRQLAGKGWLSLDRASTRKIDYRLTSAGRAELAKRALGRLARDSEGSRLIHGSIEAYVMRAKARGVTTVILAGSSEADSLLESICSENGLTYLKSADPERIRHYCSKHEIAVVQGENGPLPSSELRGSLDLGSLATTNFGEGSGGR